MSIFSSTFLSFDFFELAVVFFGTANCIVGIPSFLTFFWGVVSGLLTQNGLKRRKTLFHRSISPVLIVSFFFTILAFSVFYETSEKISLVFYNLIIAALFTLNIILIPFGIGYFLISFGRSIYRKVVT